MKQWEIKCITFDSEEHDQNYSLFIEEGWEPFAATCLGNPKYALIWLRREIREYKGGAT